MANERWQRVSELFGAALDRPAEDREAFLRASCGGDDELRREVESLVAAQERAGGFLSSPALVDVQPTTSSVPPGLEGRHIGPYRVVGLVGQGGMGAVYRAVRDDDVFQKTVALKLVHAGAGPEARRRFSAERKILARLQHPNIAAILDGGTSAEGQPYLVMEYVEGERIDAYCASHGLGVRQRLSLFVTICRAVGYAHQNLVVHRDLKPANVLVGGDGQPKLLDFGIAKLLAPDADGVAPRTATQFPMMTPAYASPEQLRGQAVTTTSDVYSLGVVLYELVTGERPYRVASESPERTIDAVCRTEPQLPSAAARAVAGTGRPPIPPGELVGDLDTIILQALRKEPERRYPSAFGLAEDVQRHLDGRPVRARGDGVGYRLGKFVGRHRLAVASAALLLVTLVGGFATTLWQWRRAEANRLRAERRFTELHELARSFLFDFHDAIANLPGATEARQLVVERATRYLDSLASEAQLDVGLRRELAEAYQRLGDIQGGGGEGSLGKTAAALASYEKALALRQALLAHPGEEADAVAMASLEKKLSRVLAVTGDWSGAEATARSGAARLESLMGRSRADLRGEAASLYQTVGFMEKQRGNEAGALADLGKALALIRAFGDSHPDDLSARERRARIEGDLLECELRRGDVRAAVDLGRSSCAILEALVAAEPGNARYQRELVFALNMAAAALEPGGDKGDAERVSRRSLALAEGLVAADPANQGDRLALTYSLETLGDALLRNGQPREGIERLVEAGTVAEGCAGANGYSRTRLADVRAALGFALDDAATRPGLKCAVLREAVVIWEDLDARGRLLADVRQPLERARSLVAACP